MLAVLCLTLAAVSAGAHLVAWYRDVTWLEYLAKPATTSLLIVVAVLLRSENPSYRAWIVAGLALSLAGDVFLMLPGNHFVAGLVSFLLAHLAYVVAFSFGVGFGTRPLLLVPFVAVAAPLLRLLWPDLQRLRIPVVVYVAVLVAMAWQALSRAVGLETAASWSAAAGAALFVLSDATLALNRFRKPFAAAQAVIMTTYVLAQALIALSVGSGLAR